MSQPIPVLNTSPVSPDDREVLQCQKCSQILPKSKFRNGCWQWCIYCVAEDTASNRDNQLRRRTEELSRQLIKSRNSAQAMSTMEDFFAEYDNVIGGPAMVASRFETILDGLIAKKNYAAAGTLLLQVERLRLHVQRQHAEDDFTQMNLEQKRVKLQLLIAEAMLEQSDRDAKENARKPPMRSGHPAVLTALEAIGLSEQAE